MLTLSLSVGQGFKLQGRRGASIYFVEDVGKHRFTLRRDSDAESFNIHDRRMVALEPSVMVQSGVNTKWKGQYRQAKVCIRAPESIRIYRITNENK